MSDLLQLSALQSLLGGNSKGGKGGGLFGQTGGGWGVGGGSGGQALGMGPGGKGGHPPCFNWLRTGICHWGDACRYAHDGASGSPGGKPNQKGFVQKSPNSMQVVSGYAEEEEQSVLSSESIQILADQLPVRKFLSSPARYDLICTERMVTDRIQTLCKLLDGNETRNKKKMRKSWAVEYLDRFIEELRSYGFETGEDPFELEEMSPGERLAREENRELMEKLRVMAEKEAPRPVKAAEVAPPKTKTRKASSKSAKPKKSPKKDKGEPNPPFATREVDLRPTILDDDYDEDLEEDMEESDDDKGLEEEIARKTKLTLSILQNNLETLNNNMPQISEDEKYPYDINDPLPDAILGNVRGPMDITKPVSVKVISSIEAFVRMVDDKLIPQAIVYSAGVAEVLRRSTNFPRTLTAALTSWGLAVDDDMALANQLLILILTIANHREQLDAIVNFGERC